MKCSLRSLFSSAQFKETINRFQKLVKEELFNPSLSGINPEEWKFLRRLILNNSAKSEWVHSYEQIKVLNVLFFFLVDVILAILLFIIVSFYPIRKRIKRMEEL